MSLSFCDCQAQSCLTPSLTVYLLPWPVTLRLDVAELLSPIWNCHAPMPNFLLKYRKNPPILEACRQAHRHRLPRQFQASPVSWRVLLRLSHRRIATGMTRPWPMTLRRSATSRLFAPMRGIVRRPCRLMQSPRHRGPLPSRSTSRLFHLVNRP